MSERPGRITAGTRNLSKITLEDPDGRALPVSLSHSVVRALMACVLERHDARVEGAKPTDEDRILRSTLPVPDEYLALPRWVRIPLERTLFDLVWLNEAEIRAFVNQD